MCPVDTSPSLAAVAVTKLRTAQGMSQRRLAALAHVSHSQLAKFERGEVSPSPRWLRDVASALGTNLQGLERKGRRS